MFFVILKETLVVSLFLKDFLGKGEYIFLWDVYICI